MIEKYSKAQIVAAIKDFDSWSPGFERQLVQRIQRMKADRIYAEWEEAENKSMAALHAFSEYLKTLSSRYGGRIPVGELTADERSEYIRLAEELERAGKIADEPYKRLEKLRNLPIMERSK